MHTCTPARLAGPSVAPPKRKMHARGTVLGAHVIPLAVELRGVVSVPKYCQELGVGHLCVRV